MHGINADGLFVEAPVCENFGPPAHSNTLHSNFFVELQLRTPLLN